MLSISQAELSALPPLILMLFMASLVFSWIGLRAFYGRSVNFLTLLFLIVLPSALCILAKQIGLPTRAIIPLMHLSAAFLAALVVYEIINFPDRRLYSQYIVGLAFAGYVLILVLSASLIIVAGVGVNAHTAAAMSLAFDQVGSVLVYFGYIAMIGERSSLDLQHQAETDSLTGLGNRRAGHRILSRLHTRASTGGVKCYSVLIADVDHFKRINDALGHEAGDTVLTSIAGRLASTVRKHDSAIRWGGEEFLIVLPEAVGDEAEGLAERLRKRVAEEPFSIGDQQLVVTLSIGIAPYRTGDVTFESTLQRADHALYRSKQGGRNRSTYSPIEPV
ncbi:GGDEF domain-containing protein [Pseudomonas sp. CFBP 13711]|uniref:GGDEF domain-containing protein n=1 Tax=unclassified Pseudomonas TaxID=196821 RepID=UPI001783FAAF|nr:MULTISPECIES: GGDEF domain-containing protein [unclassified Pseudomonas]MBD8710278.1 GGDEF domain-containing protein [Pseudomonas sp. CFBP 13711]MBD8715597.1 GGDEF domain-containing protein [Pseudomonas sp. CFBP 13715]